MSPNIRKRVGPARKISSNSALYTKNSGQRSSMAKNIYNKNQITFGGSPKTFDRINPKDVIHLNHLPDILQKEENKQD